MEIPVHSVTKYRPNKGTDLKPEAYAYVLAKYVGIPGTIDGLCIVVQRPGGDIEVTLTEEALKQALDDIEQNRKEIAESGIDDEAPIRPCSDPDCIWCEV